MQDLQAVFNQLKAALKKYEGPLTAKIDTNSKYDLWSIKDLEIGGKKKAEVYFAGVILHKTYVGFYFMPIYTQKNFKNAVGGNLLKNLKGKSCFHLKEWNPVLQKEIKNAINLGLKLYKKRGWV